MEFVFLNLPPDIRRGFALSVGPKEFLSVRVQCLAPDLFPQQVPVLSTTGLSVLSDTDDDD